MSEICKTCLPVGSATDQGLLLGKFEYKTSMTDTAIVLINSAREETCPDCGEKSYYIPDPSGLNKAIAVTRAKLAFKLRADEIRFVRKAMEATAKEISDLLGVSIETVSRWENGKLTMSPSNEKLFRLAACFNLAEKALGIDFDPKEIASLSIQSVDLPSKLIMEFQRVTVKRNDKKPAEAYVDILKAA